MRSSVVLPVPLRPDRVSRSRRSSLNETPRNSGVPGDVLAEVGCDRNCHRGDGRSGPTGTSRASRRCRRTRAWSRPRDRPAWGSWPGSWHAVAVPPRSCGLRAIALVALVSCTVLATGAPAGAQAPRLETGTLPAAQPPHQTSALPLAGMVVAIDPGHQLGGSRHLRQINRKVWVGFWKPCNTTGTATNGGYPGGHVHLAGRPCAAYAAAGARRHGADDPDGQLLRPVGAVHRQAG